jgi:hypothetical protein
MDPIQIDSKKLANNERKAISSKNIPKQDNANNASYLAKAM